MLMKYVPAGIFLILIFVPLALSCAPPALKPNPVVIIGDTSFTVEIADTQEKRTRGLSWRQDLTLGHGMLFVFEEEQDRHFWMKDMKISLDIAFIDQNLRIIEVYRNVPPCTGDPCPLISSSSPAQYVLEVESGGLQNVSLKSRIKIS